jgi:epoxyqueuosine reductase
MDRLADALFAHLSGHGYQTRMVSINHLASLQKDIDEIRDRALFDNEFYRERLNFFNFLIPESLPEARSLIVAAVPRPQTRAIFTWKSRRAPLIIPPTYTSYDGISRQFNNLVAKFLKGKKYKSEKTTLPLKLLAARSGLCQYGRNNICYIPGMGSFFQLVGVCSDMPCEEDSWQEVKMMENCRKCELCRKACPTGAIPSDRFLLRAELCITYHNEKNGDVAFPNWIDASWHNCLVGCMRCQRACPENRKFIQWFGGEEEFSEKETTLLLKGKPVNNSRATTLAKLKNLDLIDYLDNLQRNLSVFFNESE